MLSVFAARIYSDNLTPGCITELASFFHPFNKLRIVELTFDGTDVYRCTVGIHDDLEARHIHARTIRARTFILARELFKQCATLQEVRM